MLEANSLIAHSHVERQHKQLDSRVLNILTYLQTKYTIHVMINKQMIASEICHKDSNGVFSKLQAAFQQKASCGQYKLKCTL